MLYKYGVIPRSMSGYMDRGRSILPKAERPWAILLSLGPYNLISSRDQSIFVLLYDH